MGEDDPSADCGDTTRDNVLDPKHKVFLSHSGAQKNFVEQLCVDLERCDRYPLFDKRRDSLPIGKKFPELIFEAIEQCEVGVVVLSEDFFMRSKWPMVELEAMTKNRKLEIIPVLMGVSLNQIRDRKHQESWLSIWRGWAAEDERIDIGRWLEALEALGPVNSLIYDGVSEVSFRKEIVQAVCKFVRPETRWKDFHIQGRCRLAKVICDKINEAKVSTKHGIRLVGLYGVGGIGKTTICQSLCNEYLTRMQGRVYHMELGSASNSELLQGALESLTDKSHDFLRSLNVSQCEDLLKREMGKQAIFLVIDNMSDDTKSIEQAKIFLSDCFHKGSIIIVTARSLEVLKLCHLGIPESNCLEMPELHQDEAKSLFMDHAISDDEARRDVDDDMIDSCVMRCYFEKGDGKSYHYHPLALKVLGVQLGRNKYDRSKWAAVLKEVLKEVDTFNCQRQKEHPVFSILRRSYDCLLPMDQMLFMDVALYLPQRVLLDFNMTAFEWLSMVDGRRIIDIMEGLERLRGWSLLHDLGGGRFTGIGMHDLWREFAVIESRVGDFECRRWVFEVGEPSAVEEGIPSGGCWQKMKRMRFLGDGLKSAEGINFDYFSNITVLMLCSNINVPGGLVLDVNKLKLVKSFELMLGRRGEVEVEVVGLHSMVHLQFLHLGQAQLSAAVIDSIGQLRKLRVLCMTNFDGPRLPDLSKLIALEDVHFESCSRVTSISGLSSRLSELRVLNLNYCSSLRSVGLGLGELVALHRLHLHTCKNLNELPNLSKLTRLETLDISLCSMIESVPGLDDLVDLKCFQAEGCKNVKKLPNLQKLTNLEILDISQCNKLESVPGLDDLVGLKGFSAEGFENLKKLPNLQKLTNLETLIVEQCRKLKTLPGLDDLISLKFFIARDCGDIVELPNLHKLTNLEQLDIHHCSKLKSVPGLNELVSLKYFTARGCGDIVELPNLQKLTNLEGLDIGHWSKLESVPGLDDLVGLKGFLAEGCENVKKLPNLQKLTNLEVLDIRQCSKLKLKSVLGLDDLVALKQILA